MRRQFWMYLNNPNHHNHHLLFVVFQCPLQFRPHSRRKRIEGLLYFSIIFQTRSNYSPYGFNPEIMCFV